MRNWQSMVMTLAALAAMMLDSVAVGQCETWHAFGNGLPAGVTAFAFYNGALYAAGNASDNGGSYYVGWIRTWNSSSGAWQSLGGVPSQFSEDTRVNALLVHDGKLVVGGAFDPAGDRLKYSIGRWNGSSWDSLDNSVGLVNALAIYDGELIAAGYFENAGGQTANNIARWNGSAWQPLGAGIGDESGYPRVYALAVFDGDLFAGGHFTSAGGHSANGIARWNGSQWKRLASGIGAAPEQYYFPAVTDLKVYRGELIAAGQFATAGSRNANGIARWNGSAWHTMGSTMADGTRGVWALMLYNNNLIISGEFVTDAPYPTPNVARWSGSAWQFFGNDIKCIDGCQYSDDAFGVFSLFVYHGDLIVAGGFNVAGDSPAYDIARWHDCAVCPSDITRDGKVDSADLMAVLNSWGPCQSSKTYNKWYELYLQPLAPANTCPADIFPLGGDGRVDHHDLVAILSAWGSCPHN